MLRGLEVFNARFLTTSKFNKHFKHFKKAKKLIKHFKKEKNLIKYFKKVVFRCFFCFLCLNYSIENLKKELKYSYFVVQSLPKHIKRSIFYDHF